MQAWASECVLEMAVPPVAASAYWTLQSAAAMVATQLGTTLRYIMQQHSMWHMAQVGSIATPCATPDILQGPVRLTGASASFLWEVNVAPGTQWCQPQREWP